MCHQKVCITKSQPSIDDSTKAGNWEPNEQVRSSSKGWRQSLSDSVAQIAKMNAALFFFR